MSKYTVVRSPFASGYILKSPDKRSLSFVTPQQKELEYTAKVLNEETSALRAEIADVQTKYNALVQAGTESQTEMEKRFAAKDAEIERLRTFTYQVAYLTAGDSDEAKAHMHDWFKDNALDLCEEFDILEEYAKKPSTDATDVTPDDDTQKLPELVECPDCEYGLISKLIGENVMEWATCPRCNGTRMVEKLPFAYEDALEQAPTPEPKFKVGDKVTCLNGYFNGTAYISSVRVGRKSKKLVYGLSNMAMTEFLLDKNGFPAVCFENEIEHAD